jgi:hypothetical protein
MCPVMRTVNNQGKAETCSNARIFAMTSIRTPMSVQETRGCGTRGLIAKIVTFFTKLRKRHCGACTLKSGCTKAPRCGFAKHLYEDALNRMQERLTPAMMKIRRSTEHPFATMKYRIVGYPRLLTRGLSGSRVEVGIAAMAYNIKCMTNVLGAPKPIEALDRA